MKSLFLSHSTVDEDLANATALYLRETGVEPVQVSHAIRSAEDWSERIRGELQSCDAALFLVTPHYVERPAWLYMEWAAAWVQGKPPHLLLIDVGRAELPDVMSETQITVFEGKTEPLARNLLSPITGLKAGDARCVTLSGRLVNLISTERSKWGAAKWARVTSAISTGVASLPDADLDWVVTNDRAIDLVTQLRDDFAHPALVHKVARYLIGRGRREEAATIASLLPDQTQVALFRDILAIDPQVAETVARDITSRQARRACAVAAAERESPELSELIADMTEHAYDRRVIAEALLQHGFRDGALRVIDKADKAYEKANFAFACIAAGEPDMAVEVASGITLNKELRRVGERLIEGHHEGELQEVVAFMEKNYEKRLLAVYALERGAQEEVKAIAETITTSSDLLELAKNVYDTGAGETSDGSWIEIALRLLFLMKQNAERRKFVEHILARDPAAAVLFAKQALQTSVERQKLAVILSRAGLERDALEVADLIERDEDREQLFWYALANREESLVKSVVESLSDPLLRARLEAVRAAAVADYDPGR